MERKAETLAMTMAHQNIGLLHADGLGAPFAYSRFFHEYQPRTCINHHNSLTAWKTAPVLWNDTIGSDGCF